MLISEDFDEFVTLQLLPFYAFLFLHTLYSIFFQKVFGFLLCC